MATPDRTATLIALVFFATLLVACRQPPAAPARDEPSPIGHATVTYQGDIPCADCPGQQLTVTLFPDRTYRLRRVYLGVDAGRNVARYSLGRWARAQDDGAGLLRLSGDAATPLQFRIVGADTLQLLDTRGHPIASPHNHDLQRLAQPDPIAGPLPLRGMYAYMADAASFQECRTGKRFPVLITNDHLRLERAYLAARDVPGTPLLATFEGRFVEQSPEPGMAAREHIVVERFLMLRPGETCAADALAKATLLNTYWRPVELEGQPVTIRAGTREPHLILDLKDNQVHGYSGCNSYRGTYEHTADKLRFHGIAATMMACLHAGDLEHRFFAALNAAASHRITGDALELRDQDGKVRARFEARYLR